MSNVTLTATQLDHYRAQGYVALRDFVAAAEIAALRRAVERLIERAAAGHPVAHPQDFAFSDLDTGQVLNRISRPLLHSDEMLCAYGHPGLLGAAHDLYGASLVPFAESIVIKMPEQGAPFAWHQDGSFKNGLAIRWTERWRRKSGKRYCGRRRWRCNSSATRSIPRDPYRPDFHSHSGVEC